LSDDELIEEDHHPQDLKGCFLFAFRTSGCIMWLTITMFFAIICAAIISLFSTAEKKGETAELRHLDFGT
jgi:hypothetical protein